MADQSTQYCQTYETPAPSDFGDYRRHLQSARNTAISGNNSINCNEEDPNALETPNWLLGLKFEKKEAGQPPDFTEDDVRNAFENYFGRCWNPDGTLANDDDDKLLKREWDAGNILDDEARRQSQIASLMPSHLEKVDTNQSLEASPQEDHFRSPPPSQAASEGSEFGPNA